MSFKSELKMDFETFRKHTDTPIFHRLKFDRTSIYLTKSTFCDLLTSKNDHGYYRIFSWDDWRAKPLLGFELGDQSPALGFVNLIGHYTPTQHDLTEVQYVSEEGRAYYDAARSELEGIKRPERAILNKKIDSSTFMRMGEIIPVGSQGKAIYGEGNFIIDGAAGTGKSTTVLQKIKLLEKHDRVSPKKILVLVKNESVINEFNELLKTIGIAGLKIETIKSFESNWFQNNTKEIDLVIDSTWEKASLINEYLTTLKKEEDLLRTGMLSDIENNERLTIKFVDNDIDLSHLLCEYYKLRDDFIALRRKNRNKINERKKEIRIELEEYKGQLTNQIIQKKKEKSRFSIKRLFQSSELYTSLTLGEKAQIRDAAAKKEKVQNTEIEKLSKNLKEKEENELYNIAITTSNIKKYILSEKFSDIHTSNIEESRLLNLQIRKLAGASTYLHTIIVDEAQDASLSNIHLAWLTAKNIILTGDELQKETLDGIGSWDNLGKLKNCFSKDGQINVFTLSHNFRQTFELGNFSFNFRQHILGKPIIDIGEEYFENQKGFNKPQLALINKASEFSALVKDKIRLVDMTFSDSVPVVIFYENDASLNRLSDILDNSNIKYGLDGDESTPVMFVDIDDIAGRSFPVVLMPLINATNDNSIYVMISRAKYDLCIFTGKGREINRHLESLLSVGIMVHYEANGG